MRKTFPQTSKIFSLIIRIRENEKKGAVHIGTLLIQKYYIVRDCLRVTILLFISKFVLVDEKRCVEFLAQCYRLRKQSSAQLFQDILAYFISPKESGYFVEFGATDGCFLSNTCFLEQQHHWKGILAEPAKGWAEKLKNNRTFSIIDYRCVWSRSGDKIEFIEDELPEISGVSTTLDKNRMSDKVSTYVVDSVSLNDLLDEHNAPKYIDYISIDTEGSEFEILENFDFSRYKFGLLTIEHNYQADKRGKLLALLNRNNYKRIFQEISAEDDWYVPA